MRRTWWCWFIGCCLALASCGGCSSKPDVPPAPLPTPVVVPPTPSDPPPVQPPPTSVTGITQTDFDAVLVEAPGVSGFTEKQLTDRLGSPYRLNEVGSGASSVKVYVYEMKGSLGVYWFFVEGGKVVRKSGAS